MFEAKLARALMSKAGAAGAAAAGSSAQTAMLVGPPFRPNGPPLSVTITIRVAILDQHWRAGLLSRFAQQAGELLATDTSWRPLV